MILGRSKSKNVHLDLNDLFTPEVKLHIFLCHLLIKIAFVSSCSVL